MSSRTKRFLASSWVAAGLFAAGAAHADLVINGGFETGDFSGWATTLDLANDGVDGNQVHDGASAAFFGGAKSSISQTLATVAGSNYKVSFWLKLEADVLGMDTPNSFSYDFGSSSGTSLTDASAFGYTLFEAFFMATGASTDLTFHFSEGPAYWDLDSVSVTLPEPGSLALLAAAGLGGLAAARRRKPASTPA